MFKSVKIDYMDDKKILVIGSSNTDMVINTSKFPTQGETVWANFL